MIGICTRFVNMTDITVEINDNRVNMRVNVQDINAIDADKKRVYWSYQL